MSQKMMDLMNVKPGDAAQAATAAATAPKRPPIEPLRSIDMNKEVKLGTDGDDSDDAQPAKQAGDTKPAPEQKTGQAETQEPEPEQDDKLDFDVPLDGKEDEPTPEQPAQPEGEIPPGPRNYDEYPEALRPVLKALNNTQFAKHAKLLKEVYDKAAKVPELEKQIAENKSGPRWTHEHPESYRLTPEYNELQQAISYGRNEISHWRAQLLAIEMGKPWRAIIGYDDKTGEPQFREVPAPEDGKVDIEAKIQVQEHLNGLRQQLGNVEARANFLRDNYKNTAKKTLDELAGISSKLFPKFPDDPAKLEAPDKSWYEMTVNALPLFSNHPLTRYIIGPMSVVANRLRLQTTKLRQQIKVLEAKLADRQLVEPGDISRTGAATNQNGSKQFIKPKRGNAIDPDEVVKFGETD